MIADFYHLAQTPLERVLPAICERVLGTGERLLIVGGAEMLPRLDALLWTFAPESFLPHGRADAPRAGEQPILLSSDVTAANGATNVALADGHWRDEALAFARAFYLFDGDALPEARSAWRMLNGRPDVERRYWKQDEAGKWVQGP